MTERQQGDTAVVREREVKVEKTEAAPAVFEDAKEQEMYDAVGAAIEPFLNVVPRDRATKVVALQSEMVAKNEAWTTYEGGPVPPEPIAPPTLTSLSPNTAVAGDAADIVMCAIGTGFTSGSIIVFNGHIEPTTFVSETEVTTGVKPSIFVVPAVCPVEVHTGTHVAGPVDFNFTDAAARKAKVEEEEPETDARKGKKGRDR